jgi:hypothetical protein
MLSYRLVRCPAGRSHGPGTGDRYESCRGVAGRDQRESNSVQGHADAGVPCRVRASRSAPIVGLAKQTGQTVFSLDRRDRSREIAELSPDLWDRSLEATEGHRSALLQTHDMVRHGEVRDERW